MDKLKWLRLFLALFSTLGHRGWKPGGDGGGDPAEKAQTQETSGQGLVEQRWRGRQGQEEAWTATSWETLPQPPQTDQANEHHHRYSHQLQRWVRRFFFFTAFFSLTLAQKGLHCYSFLQSSDSLSCFSTWKWPINGHHTQKKETEWFRGLKPFCPPHVRQWGRVIIRNTSQCNSIGSTVPQPSKTTIKLNHILSKTFSARTEYYNLNDGGIYSYLLY